MKKGKKLYEGKAKIIYASPQKNLLIQHFKDDATAFNNQKKATIEGKGILNNRISEYILSNLNQVGIKNHLVKRINMREQLVKSVEIIPIEFIVRNIAAGSLSSKLGIEEGTVLDRPLVEYCLKNDELGDPMVSREHILNFNWLNVMDLDWITEECKRINDFLQGLFRGVGIRLVDFKVEFGKTSNDEIILADEISPDTCRLWDEKTERKLDKDIFRKDLGSLVEGYQEVARRLNILHEGTNIKAVEFGKGIMKIKVIVTLKNGVLDPQGKAIQQTLNGMGHNNVNEIRQGKYFEVEINEKDEKKAKLKVEEMCKQLLANLVIEDYKIV